MSTAKSQPKPAPTQASQTSTSLTDEALTGRTSDLALIGRLWAFVKPYRLQFGLSLLLLPALSEVLVAQPRVMKVAFDQGIHHHDSSALQRAALTLAILLVGEFTLRFVQMYLTQWVGQRVMADLRRHMFDFLLKQRLAFFDRRPVGRLVSRVTNDVDALGELFASGAVTALGDVVTLVRIVIAMVALSPSLSLFAFVAVPPLMLLVEWTRRRSRDALREIRSLTSTINAYLNEQVQGISVVQAFGQEQRCQREFDEINGAYRRANFANIRYDSVLYAVVEMFASVCIATLIFVGANTAGVDAPAASIGTLVAFVQYIQKFFEPLRDLSSKYTILQSSMAGAERIFQLLDSEEPDALCKSSGTVAAVPGSPRVAFDNVTFSYGGGRTTLKNVSFAVERGQKVALVGATGAGKTTVLSLMQRLYEIDEGTIRIDGGDLREFGRAELRSRFVVVPQDSYLFPGDVLSNIALGEEHPDLAKAEKAAQDVGLDQLLARRGEGLRMPVTERGQNFSLGERQLIALARALYRDPEMLLLDEATSSVDSETEATVQTAVARALEGRTAIVIAHRLSTIRNADLILVFHRGQIVERGTHQQLLDQGGVYARLHRLQHRASE